MSIWGGRDAEQWAATPEIYQRISERLLRVGEPLLAYDVAQEALQTDPSDTRLLQLQALALARSGATHRANRMLQALVDAGHADEETLGMLGRTEKDLALLAASADERERHLRRSADAYGTAYQVTGGYWTGINAATVAFLSGDTGRATSLAASVRSQCLQAIKTEEGDHYWALATLGEAALVLGDLPEAEEYYRRAAQAAGPRYADLQSSRRNARLLLSSRNIGSAEIERALRVPNVIAFSGHMIDRPDRSTPRFPSVCEGAVAAALRHKLDELNAAFGYASAACGSDILFAEAMLDRGGEIVIVLPYEEEEFLRDSVEFAGAKWRERFETVIGRAAQVVLASKQKLAVGGVAFEYANELVFGLATIRAKQLDTNVRCLAVWDGKQGDGAGGTGSAVGRWREAGHTPELIDLSQIVHGTRATDSAAAGASKRPAIYDAQEPGESKVLAMLFADAVGFSKLREAEVPQFVRCFTGAIADLLRGFDQHVLARNTWGDGLYFVFSSVESAGSFALDLCDLVGGTDWSQHRLPAGLNLRIALHAGPVYEGEDPITQRKSYYGTHVSRAARIEPITPPGNVYASEAFAALGAAQQARGFTCEYAGQTPMAKGFGTFPTYAVKRSAARG